MNNDMHLINEEEYASIKKKYLESKEDFMLSAMGAFESIVDSFTELAMSGENSDYDIYTLVYKYWNTVAKDTKYAKLTDPVRHLTDYLLTRYWLFGDVFNGMQRDNEIKPDGTCIGHSNDSRGW